MLSTQKKEDSIPAHRRDFGQICTRHQIARTRHAKKKLFVPSPLQQASDFFF